MATNNRGGNRRGKGGRKTNNPKGRNQRDSGSRDGAKGRPLAAAIGAAAAVGAGYFLWSRRDRTSDQIGDLDEQLSEARDVSDSASDTEAENSDRSSGRRGGGRSQVEIAEEALSLKEIGAPS